ncbi:MAG: hypothetical protein Q9218_004290 [Villophora microphyllina]
MLAKTVLRRRLKVFSVFAILAVFLSLLPVHQEHVSLLQDHVSNQRRVISHRVVEHYSFSSFVKSIAVPFGNPYLSLHVGRSSLPLAPTKRAITFTYRQAWCNGQRLWDKIQQVYKGALPTEAETFHQDDIDNAWLTVDTGKILEESFHGWSKEVLGRVAEEGEVNRTRMWQQKEYTTVSETRRGLTGAFYECVYIRSAAAIIAINLASPLVKLEKDSGLTKAEANKQVPKLARFSDMAWLVWSDVLSRNEPANGPVDELEANKKKGYKPQDPGRLRYLGHDFIANDESRVVIDKIMADRATNKKKPVAPWPGHIFGMHQEEGLALLGTPNGGGTAYLLMNRFKEMGVRVPMVRIWSPKGADYASMMWYLNDP